MQPPTGRTWLQRNTRWLVMGIVLGGLILLGASVAGILLIISTAIRSTEVFEASVERAQADDRVVDLLGSPIEAGFLISGSIRMENREGDADLSIPLEGPRGEATLTVVAKRTNGIWSYRHMQVRPLDEVRAPLDLLGNERDSNLKDSSR